jgi:hypothetical protein
MTVLAGSSTLPISADEPLTGLSETARLAHLSAAGNLQYEEQQKRVSLRPPFIIRVAQAFGFAATWLQCLHTPSCRHCAWLKIPTTFSSFLLDGVVHLPGVLGLDEAHARRLAVVRGRLRAHG